VEVEAQRFAQEIDQAVQTVLFRVTQEAINNVARHSKATCASIRFWSEGDDMHVSIDDDGAGFNVQRTRQGASPPGLGLLGMQERASLVDGDVEIESEIDEGTRVHIRIPDKSAGVDQ
jgi:two-component system sensor histidine kinase DegS